MTLIGGVGGTQVLPALVAEAGKFHQACRFASAELARFEDLLTQYFFVERDAAKHCGGATA